MPSPDFSQYIDLTVDDRTAEDLYDQAVEYARVALPEFTPRPGTIEDAVLQATAFLASQNIATINRLPYGLMEGILRLMGLERYESSFSTVDVEFTLSAPGETVPIDFYVVYDAQVGDTTVQYSFKTTAAVTAAPGEYTVTATLTCQVAGVIPSLEIGTELTIVQPNATILSCVTTQTIVQGDEPETDVEYFSRGTTFLASLSTTLVTSTQVEQYIISNFSDVHRCKVYDLRNPVRDTAGSVNLSTGEATTTSSFVSNSDFTDYTRIINRNTTTAGQASLLSGLYDTTTGPGSTKFSFTPEGTLSVTPISAEFIDMKKLRVDAADDAAGFFVIVVCDENGNPISDSLKTTIQTAVSERIVAGLSFIIIDALICDIEFIIDISVDPEYSAPSIVTTVGDEIESFISPANWPEWNSTVRVFDVVVRSNNIPGVAYVNSVVGSATAFVASYPPSPGNEFAVTEVNPGGGVTALELQYLGSLPRATVEVTVS